MLSHNRVHFLTEILNMLGQVAFPEPLYNCFLDLNPTTHQNQAQQGTFLSCFLVYMNIPDH